MDNPLSAAPVSNATFELEVATLIISALNLEKNPDEIQPEEALYEGSLGLDSIDILELSLVVSKHYGVQIKADSADNFHIFTSLRSLAAYIAEHRSK